MSNPEVHALLVAARERYADPARYCKGTLARNAHGRAVSERSATAVAWCAMGHLLAEADNESWTWLDAQLVLKAAAERLGFRPTSRKNAVAVCSDAGHEHGLAMFAAAIAATAPGGSDEQAS